MKQLKEKLLDMPAYLGIKGENDYLEKKVDEIVSKFEELRAKESGYKKDDKTLIKALFILFFNQ